MPKFFFEAESFDGKFIDIQGKTVHHIVNVLRQSIGDKILLCDGNRTDYITKLVFHEIDKKSATARFEVLDIKESLTEPPIFIRLFQSVIKWENLDLAIQKSIEVGASEIVPVVTKRSIYKLADVHKKTGRYNEIAKSAAQQSHRGIIPKVNYPKILDETILCKESTGFFACCCEKKTLSKSYKSRADKIDLWVGPEGGFTDAEKKSLLSNNILPFSLGPRVLRSETASIVSIVNLLLFYG